MAEQHSHESTDPLGSSGGSAGSAGAPDRADPGGRLDAAAKLAGAAAGIQAGVALGAAAAVPAAVAGIGVGGAVYGAVKYGPPAARAVRGFAAGIGKEFKDGWDGRQSGAVDSEAGAAGETEAAAVYTARQMDAIDGDVDSIVLETRNAALTSLAYSSYRLVSLGVVSEGDVSKWVRTAGERLNIPAPEIKQIDASAKAGMGNPVEMPADPPAV